MEHINIVPTKMSFFFKFGVVGIAFTPMF